MPPVYALVLTTHAADAIPVSSGYQCTRQFRDPYPQDWYGITRLDDQSLQARSHFKRVARGRLDRNEDASANCRNEGALATGHPSQYARSL